jgi:hypothetical protein
MDDLEPGRPARSRRTAIFVVAAVALVAAVAGTAVALNDDGSDSDSPEVIGTTTSSTAPVQSVPPATVAPVPSTVTAPAVDASSAVWPYAGSTTRYSTPDSAAKSFATEFLRFSSPRMGAFQQGDSRSGEVTVRPNDRGPLTTVFVRQLEDNTWWVLGAATPNIQISEPATLSSISSPVRLRGTSTAFEATVQTEVRQDGSTAPLAEGFVMGGSMGELAPFDGTLTFSRPTAKAGAVVLFTESAENGQVWEASVVRVAF